MMTGDGGMAHFLGLMLGDKHEDQQGDQEDAQRWHMAGDAALHQVACQLAWRKKQRRQGLPQPAVEVKQAFEGFENQVADGAVMRVGVLAANITKAALQFGVAVQALLPRLGHEGVFVTAEPTAQSIKREKLKLLHRFAPENDMPG